MKKKAAATLNSRSTLRSNSSRERQKDDKITTYCEVVNNMLEKYASDDVIPKTDAEIMRFTHRLIRL